MEFSGVTPTSDATARTVAPLAVTGKRLPELDAIRGIAILLVLIHHYLAGAHSGLTGADLFFVLSGFLIGGIIFRSGHRDGLRPNFYRRRVARLMPLCLVVLALYLTARVLLATKLGVFVPAAIAAASTILLAQLSWRYFEQPILAASVSTRSSGACCARLGAAATAAKQRFPFGALHNDDGQEREDR